MQGNNYFTGLKLQWWGAVNSEGNKQGKCLLGGISASGLPYTRTGVKQIQSKTLNSF